MDAPTPAASAEKTIESEAAEEICQLLEQTILKYFPQNDRPKSSSVPLVPHRQETSPT